MVKADDRKYYFRQIDKAFFISPIVDMEKVILDMMRWADITEEKLREKQLITTGFGETLSWEYLCYVRNHPVNWSVPTCILYGDKDNLTSQETIHKFDGPGVLQGQHNVDKSIESFARSCFKYALDTKQTLWFATKDTISKKYDHTFKDIFQEIFDAEYKEQFDAAGIEYFYTLIDDAVARVMKSEGGYIWACKNYDGDVMSDMISSAFGSLAMMTSVLVSPDGKYEYEAAHGTVMRHYYKHLAGEETSTNSVATIFAWSGALRKRGELDGIQALQDFADKLEAATIKTIEDGKMTKDLALITTLENPTVLNSENFIKAIRETLEGML